MEDNCARRDGDAPLATISLRTLLPKAKFFAVDAVSGTTDGDQVRDGWDAAVERLVSDPHQVEPGDVLAILPECADPLAAGCQAMARGAAAVLVEQILPLPIPQCIVPDVVTAAGRVSAALADHPSNSLLMIGVVGADGKTSTALLTAAVLRAAGHRTAYETDLGACDGVVQSVPTERAADALSIQPFLADARDAGTRAAVVELSDAVVRGGALANLRFDVIVVCGGASRDQSESFGAQTLDLALERLRDGGVAVVNADSPSGMAAADRAGVPLLTYALRNEALVTAKVFDQQPGLTTLMVTAGDTTCMMETPLTGPAMASNQLAAIAAGMLLEVPLHQAISAVTGVRSIPGRMQRLPGFGEATVVLDAAETPARFSAALRSLRRERCGGRLWVVMAIDDRGDSTDRAACGHLAERFADQVIVTSGDAGRESFLRAAHDWLDGVQEAAAPRLIADPGAALQWALERAADHDTILVAGRWATGGPAPRRAKIDAMARLVTDGRAKRDEDGDHPQIFAHPALSPQG